MLLRHILRVLLLLGHVRSLLGERWLRIHLLLLLWHVSRLLGVVGRLLISVCGGQLLWTCGGPWRHRHNMRLNEGLSLLATDLARLKAGLGLRRLLDAQIDNVPRRLDHRDSLDNIRRRCRQAPGDTRHSAWTIRRHRDHLPPQHGTLEFTQTLHDRVDLLLQVWIVQIKLLLLIILHILYGEIGR